MVAATAGGMAPARYTYPFLVASIRELAARIFSPLAPYFGMDLLLIHIDRFAIVALQSLDVGLPFLVCGTIALLVMRLREPRPPWGGLVKQPGFWGCVAPLAAICVLIGWPQYGVDVHRAVVGASVVVAWLALAISRRWRAEASWIDRAGRVVGVLWLATVIPAVLVGG